METQQLGSVHGQDGLSTADRDGQPLLKRIRAEPEQPTPQTGFASHNAFRFACPYEKIYPQLETCGETAGGFHGINRLK
jgi:hypothetical protein